MSGTQRNAKRKKASDEASEAPPKGSKAIENTVPQAGSKARASTKPQTKGAESKSKVNNKALKKPNVAAEEVRSAPKSSGADELDDLFAGLKKQKKEPSEVTESKSNASKDDSSKSPRAASKTKAGAAAKPSGSAKAKPAPTATSAALSAPEDDMGFTRGNKTSGKRTEEGFRVYSVDELNIGQGGDTENCPFDCECCH